jgi:hypothetical protein
MLKKSIKKSLHDGRLEVCVSGALFLTKIKCPEISAVRFRYQGAGRFIPTDFKTIRVIGSQAPADNLWPQTPVKQPQPVFMKTPVRTAG